MNTWIFLYNFRTIWKAGIRETEFRLRRDSLSARLFTRIRFNGIEIRAFSWNLQTCARKEYFSRSVGCIERKLRGKIGISGDAVMFSFQNPTYPTEYRQIHARIRETDELLNTSNAKEQLVQEYERGEKGEKRCIGWFWIEIKIGFCERIRHFPASLMPLVLVRIDRELRPQKENTRMKYQFFILF